jgi:hypothetical protein
MATPKDADLQWLLDQIPGRDTLGLEETKAGAIIDIIERNDRGTLPVTIGLFGTWGSGKTTTLAYVAKTFTAVAGKPFDVIYFNAWKYAGFMEAVPALIYKILMAVDPQAPPEHVLGQIMLGLGKKYAEPLGEWTQLVTGVDLIKAAEDLAGIRDVIQDAKHPAAAAAKQYYTQLDRSQDLLAETCRKSKRTIVALIDELDRCDPGEAFDIIKQLRVFFTMRNVPIVFVLSVNPDPVGQAVKHQFGLTSEWGDYEARKILEKFVDHYVEMDGSNSIVGYVRAIWKGAGLDIRRACFIGRVDASIKLPPFAENTVRNASFNECILADNRIYGNRRLLGKCLSRVRAKGYAEDAPWTAWHLELAEQAYPALRQTIALLAGQLIPAAEAAHKGLIGELCRSGCLAPDGSVVKGSALNSDKGAAAWAAYRSLFWEGLQAQIERKHQWKDNQRERRAELLEGLLGDYRKMDFVAAALMQPLDPIRFAGDEIAGWDELFGQAHLEWVLNNY